MLVNQDKFREMGTIITKLISRLTTVPYDCKKSAAFIPILFIIFLFLTSCTAVKKEIEVLPVKNIPIVQAKSAAMPVPVAAREKTLKLMTYNIRHGVGIDNKLDLGRVIDTIKRAGPDIIALNEVDHLMLRSQMQKQDQMIAESLGYNVVYGYTISRGSKYGNALVTKYPVKSSTNHQLPGDRTTEPRGLIEAELDIDGKTIKVMVTHLSTQDQERPRQVEFIEKKLKETKGPKILMGDFNARPLSDEVRRISKVMKDSAGKEYNTFPANKPNVRIDYIFVSDEIDIKSSKPIESQASDHMPVVAEVVLNGDELKESR
ncbi:MAG: hypothetical protein PWR27_1855 [Petroclostridium sp.]|nr:hypothetical protein [Petroclostridium sp.]